MKIGDYEISIGADPEVFLFRDDQPISPHGIVPGSKLEPFALKRGALQCDGLAAEANVAPARTAYRFMLNTLYVQRELKKRLPAGVTYQNKSVVSFDPDYFNEQPAEVKVLGCDPDYCVYSNDPYIPVNNPNLDNNNNTRTAGGHIHLGWTEGADINDPNHKQKCIQLVHVLDALVGFPLFDLSADPTKVERAAFYGQWGSFRPKPYGLEYRTPGNNWINNPELIKFAFDQTCAAFKHVAVEKLRFQLHITTIKNYIVAYNKLRLRDGWHYELEYNIREKLQPYFKLVPRRDELNRERVIT